jgi:hypothetical protein
MERGSRGSYRHDAGMKWQEIKRGERISPASLRGVHARDWHRVGDDPDRWVPPVSGREKERVPLRAV